MPDTKQHHIVCKHEQHNVRVAFWLHGDANSDHVIVCVHGLTRLATDFDALAAGLLQDAVARGLPTPRIVCIDVPGRGGSDWLPNPEWYQVPVYASLMLQVLAQLQPIRKLDWVGTSMGGLIGLAVAATQNTPLWPLSVPLHKMVLNDVGPEIAWEAVQRIGDYVADTGHFATLDQGLQYLEGRCAPFGPHTPEQWRALNTPALVPHAAGGWRLHYDPAIAQVFTHVTPESFAQGTEVLWQVYDGLTLPLLVVRGADSDLLPAAAARAMQQRGPHAQLVEFAGVGHAPTLVQPEQIAAVSHFLL